MRRHLARFLTARFLPGRDVFDDEFRRVARVADGVVTERKIGRGFAEGHTRPQQLHDFGVFGNGEIQLATKRAQGVWAWR
jgi:hypothetical protein